ncbi:MAG: ADP-ribose pyrophosphatase, partial [Actinobacteria bacterium]|nr:ADP-ribose pyrophosphatase [Actinomycetota bacterium]NIS33259.1 ADP-ribose pyrophosphatase [Actinomycetota bacterium]NIT96766.1 ADP-ribose pyrophosphatase [Actinomycetota bacterium]NIU18601.1 ADP-ribose pyrophosphatase [Actinomycetota bacterium]NIU68168.1 ADP-ribose pyrophosphatase [Actinomycetota bacterium]
MSFETLGTRRLARGVFLELERIHLLGPGEGSAMRDVVRHPGGVAMLPIDSDGRIWFVRQYRIAV